MSGRLWQPRRGCWPAPCGTANRSEAITICRVGSAYRPNSYEPFSVRRVVKPRKSITFQTGRAARTNVLTRNYIYNDSGGGGVKVVTSVGTFKKRC